MSFLLAITTLVEETPSAYANWFPCRDSPSCLVSFVLEKRTKVPQHYILGNQRQITFMQKYPSVAIVPRITVSSTCYSEQDSRNKGWMSQLAVSLSPSLIHCPNKEELIDRLVRPPPRPAAIALSIKPGKRCGSVEAHLAVKHTVRTRDQTLSLFQHIPKVQNDIARRVTLQAQRWEECKVTLRSLPEMPVKLRSVRPMLQEADKVTVGLICILERPVKLRSVWALLRRFYFICYKLKLFSGYFNTTMKSRGSVYAFDNCNLRSWPGDNAHVDIGFLRSLLILEFVARCAFHNSIFGLSKCYLYIEFRM